MYPQGPVTTRGARLFVGRRIKRMHEIGRAVNCQLHWVGIDRWWCGLDPSGQAAWVQAIATIFAIAVAIAIPYCQRNHERAEKTSNDRKIVMSAAANLDIALAYQHAIFDFMPAGDGKIGHDELTLEQARYFMKLQPQTRDALRGALERSHYFSEELCEQIVRLSIEAASYERIIDDQARLTPDVGADAFFARMQGTNRKLVDRLGNVRQLLQNYLPKQD